MPQMGGKGGGGPREDYKRRETVFVLKLHFNNSIIITIQSVSNCWVNTTSRWGIRQLGISFGSIFLLFPMKVTLGHVRSSQGKSLAPGS